MPDILFDINVDAHQIEVELLGASERLRAEIKVSMDLVGQGLQNFVVTDRLAGGALQRRSGNLGRAIFYKVEESGDVIITTVGADLGIAPYARIQDEGGTIVPKNAQYLTVPLAAAQTPAGIARFTAPDVISNPAAFGFVGTFFAKQVLFGKLAGGGIVPLFALKESVTLQATGWLTGTLDVKADWIEEQVAQGVDRALAAGG